MQSCHSYSVIYKKSILRNKGDNFARMNKNMCVGGANAPLRPPVVATQLIIFIFKRNKIIKLAAIADKTGVQGAVKPPAQKL